MLKKSTTNQEHCYLFDERRYLQFSAVNTSLRDIGYDNVHFPPFSSRVNWRRYHPTTPLVSRESDFQGYLNNHAMIHQIQDPRILPLPTDITSPPDSQDHSPLQYWDHTSPVVSSRPDFAAPETTVPVTHINPSPPLAPNPSVEIKAIVQAVLQATLAANATSVAANPTLPPSRRPFLRPQDIPLTTSYSRHKTYTATTYQSYRHTSALDSRAPPLRELPTSQEPSPAPSTRAPSSAYA